MTVKVPIAIIGGGALGLAIAHALLSRGRSRVILLEKNEAFGLEQSGSNSGVIHAGFLYASGTLMADLCVKGARMLYEFLKKHGVPHQRTGKLVVAIDAQQEKRLETYFKRAAANGLKNVKMLSGRQAQKLEPGVGARAALFVPQSGIFDTALYVAALYRQAAALHNTPDMLLRGCRVVGVAPQAGGFRLDVEQRRAESERWQVDCEVLINAAGLYALDIAKMLLPQLTWQKQYLRGEYCQFNRRPDLFVDMNVYPTPTPIELPGGGHFVDLGAHFTPRVGPDERGNPRIAKEILVGPIFKEISDPTDHRSSLQPLEFYNAVKPFFPRMKKEDLYRGHTGILGLIKDQTDFIIHRDPSQPNGLHLLGMESPALTASLAIAGYVADMLAD